MMAKIPRRRTPRQRQTPTRRTWSAPPPVVTGLGRLIGMVLRLPDGRRSQVQWKGPRWLAWQSATRDLLILHAGGGTVPTPVTTSAASVRHWVFHGAAPRGVRIMVAPDAPEITTSLGLIESLTYETRGFRSPSKSGHAWLHQFGDHGERGHGATNLRDPSPYPDDVLPALVADAKGHLWIKRRSGCTYTVDQWIMG